MQWAKLFIQRVQESPTPRNVEYVYKGNLRDLFVKEVNLEVNSDLLNARRTSIGYLISRSGVSKEEAIKILAEVR